MKKMDAATFQREGWLQEVNRQFLHRHGLALAITVAEDGTMTFGPCLDDREDPEGFRFAPDQMDAEFAERATRIESDPAVAERARRLGYDVQPYPTTGDRG